MREKLINIIARCNNKQIKHNWIKELAVKTDIECTESQCLNCPILDDCCEALDCKEVN